MKKRILIATLLTLSTAAAGTLAVAKPGFGPEFGRKHQKPSFQQLDANGDGELTQAEMQALHQTRFEAADSNGDGLLSAEELNAKAQERIARRTASMIERFDTDGDGALSAAEMPERPGPHKFLEKADTDGNGSISKAEFDTANAIIEAVMQKRHHRGGPEMRGAGPEAE
ncbi:EF-hand domain-containing protein [Phaeobacter sp. HF9A]|uniref:EF-hand domain-containing protein n=1 Tax=Phaeobacter sp. HF9A TaxID=2721561 RepID=UPI0014309F41|nr:calcium sensor EFh [Phaeobacter sp. HF9A]NIZ14708.1 calcium sensor EFh [Phaeobacter sp. HF9A]